MIIRVFNSAPSKVKHLSVKSNPSLCDNKDLLTPSHPHLPHLRMTQVLLWVGFLIRWRAEQQDEPPPPQVPPPLSPRSRTPWMVARCLPLPHHISRLSFLATSCNEFWQSWGGLDLKAHLPACGADPFGTEKLHSGGKKQHVKGSARRFLRVRIYLVK